MDCLDTDDCPKAAVLSALDSFSSLGELSHYPASREPWPVKMLEGRSTRSISGVPSRRVCTENEAASWRRCEKRSSIGVLRLLEYVCSGSVLDDLAMTHDRYAVADLRGDAQVMSD